MPIVMLATTGDLVRPDQNSDFNRARHTAVCHEFNYPVPNSSALLPS
jgi:hypothetical protein